MARGRGRGRGRAEPSVTLLWYPPNEKKIGSKSYGGYAWAEESLLPGGTSPVITFNDDDDLVSTSELFARADPAPTTATATAIPAAGIYKWQISEAMPWDEHPNKPETTPAALPQQEASGDSQKAQGVDISAGTGAGAANNTRKSRRARKPKRRN
jgi:hypothetical protein